MLNMNLRPAARSFRPTRAGAEKQAQHFSRLERQLAIAELEAEDAHDLEAIAEELVEAFDSGTEPLELIETRENTERVQRVREALCELRATLRALAQTRSAA